MRPFLIAGSLAVAFTLAAPTPADACSKVAPPAHSLDPALVGVDTTPPAAPGMVVATVFRRLGSVCDDDGCVDNSCGDEASIELEFTSPTDDTSPSENLGYRLQAAAVPFPAYLTAAPTLRRDFLARVIWEVPFEDSARLATEATLVAVDEAGNTSAPSAPFAIEFDGCTRPPTGETCYEPEGSCSLRATRQESGSTWPWLFAVCIAVGARCSRCLISRQSS